MTSAEAVLLWVRTATPQAGRLASVASVVAAVKRNSPILSLTLGEGHVGQKSRAHILKKRAQKGWTWGEILPSQWAVTG
ncbi:hypothetical protein A6R68_19609 [Neotoma lepida]|uniref:Uncharacterized protein n=1 Tax=Neotoma lepida TaxID=56216 RepID=A0A1A6HJ51_NEOLE|nr:hypothetical protein A6R68_19609 [Neotoma lepida]